MKKFIEETKIDKRAIGEHLGPDGRFSPENRKNLEREITINLQGKGMRADIASNRAGQILRYTEAQAAYNKAKPRININVLESIGDLAIDRATGKVDLSPESKLNLTNADNQEALKKALYKAHSIFNNYAKKLQARGGKFDAGKKESFENQLRRLEQFAATRKKLETNEIESVNNEIKNILITMQSGALLRD